MFSRGCAINTSSYSKYYILFCSFMLFLNCCGLEKCSLQGPYVRWHQECVGLQKVGPWGRSLGVCPGRGSWDPNLPAMRWAVASPCVPSVIHPMQRGNGFPRTGKQKNSFFFRSGKPTKQCFMEYILHPFIFILWVTLGPDLEMSWLSVHCKEWGADCLELADLPAQLWSCSVPFWNGTSASNWACGHCQEVISLVSNFCNSRIADLLLALHCASMASLLNSFSSLFPP